MIRTRTHVSMYRRMLRLYPPAHRARHGDDQVRLFADLIATGHSPVRLWLGLLPDLLSVLGHTQRRALIAHVARLALVPLSLINIATSTALAVVALASSAVPAWVAVPSLAMLAQGAYCLAWLSGRIPLDPPHRNRLFALGEAAALVVGACGLAFAFVSQAGSADPEYGPPTMLTLVAVHGLIGLLAARTTQPPQPFARPVR